MPSNVAQPLNALQAAISSRCEAVLRHATEAKRQGFSVNIAATAPPRQIAAPAVAVPPQLQASEPPQIVEAGAQAEVQQAAELNLAASERAIPSNEPRPAQQTLPALTEQQLPLEPGQLAEPPAPEMSLGQPQAAWEDHQPQAPWEGQQSQAAWEGQQPQAAWEGQQPQAAWEDQQPWQQQLAAGLPHPAGNKEQRVTRGSQARQLQTHQAQLRQPGSGTQQLQGEAAGNASGSAQLAKWARRAARKRERNLPWPSKKQRAAGVGEPMEVASQPAAVGGGDQAPGDMGNAPAASQGSEAEQVQGNGASGSGAEGSPDPALPQSSKKKGKKGKGSGLGALTQMFKPQQSKKKKKKKTKQKKKKNN